MMKRFVAMLVVVLMMVGCAAVACAAVPYPSCGHGEYTTHESGEYQWINVKEHKIVIKITRSCDICHMETKGTEDAGLESHTILKSDEHNPDGTHTFRHYCPKCRKTIRSETVFCSGHPHVPSPLPSVLD